MHFEVVSAQKCVLECVKRVHLLPAFSHFGSDSNEACLRADDAAENHAYAHDADVAHLFIEEPEAADNADSWAEIGVPTRARCADLLLSFMPECVSDDRCRKCQKDEVCAGSRHFRGRRGLYSLLRSP